MIEDIGPIGIAFIAIICVICLIVWFRNRHDLDEQQTGHLYMMYFYGDHSAAEIMNEIDPDQYDCLSVWNDLLYLEARGYVLRDQEYELWGTPRFNIRFEMTDEGEAAYKKYAARYGMDYYDDQTVVVQGGPNRDRRHS